MRTTSIKLMLHNVRRSATLTLFVYGATYSSYVIYFPTLIPGRNIVHETLGDASFHLLAGKEIRILCTVDLH